VNFRGKNVLAPTASTHVSSRIVDHPYVPLVIDVDAEELTSRGVDPFYVAPPAGDADDPYSSGRFWVQSTHHGRSVNVGFIGGHVLTSQHPAEERWNWSYQAETR
jgi:prepilin-type processing-associated H-X9-DG protein